MTLKRDVNPTLILIERFLELGPASTAEISAHIRISPRWTREYVKLLKAAKRVHICAYRAGKCGTPTIIYALGDAPDVKRPKPKRMRDSKAQSYAKHRDRINMKRRANRAALNGVHPKTLHYMMILGVC